MKEYCENANTYKILSNAKKFSNLIKHVSLCKYTDNLKAFIFKMKFTVVT